jgi:hypothetical protein
MAAGRRARTTPGERRQIHCRSSCATPQQQNESGAVVRTSAAFLRRCATTDGPPPSNGAKRRRPAAMDEEAMGGKSELVSWVCAARISNYHGMDAFLSFASPPFPASPPRRIPLVLAVTGSEDAAAGDAVTSCRRRPIPPVGVTNL